MEKARSSLALLGFATLLAGAEPTAAQQANFGRAFVSGTGTNSGSCYRPAPCKTFAYAITQTPAGGQIVALDTADYGPVTTTKALTIAGEGGAVAITHGADTTTITGCSIGIRAPSSEQFASYGNNNIVGNRTNISAAKTTVQQQLRRPGATAKR